MGAYLVDYVINNKYETYSTILGSLNEVAAYLDKLYKTRPLTFVKVTNGMTDNPERKEIDLEPLVRSKTYIVTYEMNDDTASQESEVEFTTLEACQDFIDSRVGLLTTFTVMEYSVARLNLGLDVTHLFS